MECPVGMVPYGVPSGTESAAYVGVGIVAYHEMVGGIGVAAAFHGIFKDAAVRLVYAYVIAEHHQINPRLESGGADLSELHLFESVGQTAYTQSSVPDCAQ